MSMRNANGKRTVCEVVREINDDLQGTGLHPVILPKLREVESMCKRMAQKLYQYNKDFDKDWWATNPDYEADLKRRMDASYLS
jgi:hypothetical protein